MRRFSSTFPRGSVERFWERVAKSDTCWLWTGPLTELGYARVTINGHRTYAHRHAYQLLVGPIPEGLELDHVCRNRACVNPAHLEPVTHQENAARGLMGRLKTHCPQGHALVPGNLAKDRHRKCLTCKRDRDRRRSRS